MKFLIVGKRSVPERDGFNFLLDVQTSEGIRPVTVSGRAWHSHEIGEKIEIRNYEFNGEVDSETKLKIRSTFREELTAEIADKVRRIDIIDRTAKEFYELPVSAGGSCEARSNPKKASK